MRSCVNVLFVLCLCVFRLFCLFVLTCCLFLFLLCCVLLLRVVVAFGLLCVFACVCFLYYTKNNQNTTQNTKTQQQHAIHKTLALKEGGIGSNAGERRMRPLGKHFLDTLCSEIVGERSNMGQMSVCCFHCICLASC